MKYERLPKVAARNLHRLSVLVDILLLFIVTRQFLKVCQRRGCFAQLRHLVDSCLALNSCLSDGEDPSWLEFHVGKHICEDTIQPMVLHVEDGTMPDFAAIHFHING